MGRFKAIRMDQAVTAAKHYFALAIQLSAPKRYYRKVNRILYKLCIVILARLVKSTLIILTIIGTSFPIGVHFIGDAPSYLDSHLSEHEYKRIAKLFGLPQSVDTSAVVVTFYKKAKAPVLGIKLPEWGGGGALGTDSIFIPMDVEYAFFHQDFQRILTHELVHLVISRKYGNVNIPRWFHEGMAMALSGEIDSDAPITLSKAVLSGKLLTLDSIKYVNRFKRDKARLAYCQSHFAVQFLILQYGQDLLPELLSEIKDRSSFESACIRVFGLNGREIDSLVNQKIKSQYQFNFLLDDTFFWFIILILAISGFVATFLRKRKRIKEMDLEEKELCP